jgi:hypothetical protein
MSRFFCFDTLPFCHGEPVKLLAKRPDLRQAANDKLLVNGARSVHVHGRERHREHINN